MINTTLVPGESYLESLKRYVGFTDDSSLALREIYVRVAPHFGPLVEDFYATIQSHPGASQAITGGGAQIARLKQTLTRWLEELFLGPHDEAYFERRARIGRVHVRISLPQAYMLTAMDRMRNGAAAVIRQVLATDQETLHRTMTALHQIMDMDLAIMLETYREDLEAKNRATERLATIGQFAAGIGHELRNPLSVIETSVFLLRQRLQPEGGELDPKVSRHLDKIAGEVKRATTTINDLLELARNKPLRRKPTSLTALLDSAISLAAVPTSIEVKARVLTPDDDLATLDHDQVIRVLTNLIVNAAQALEGQGQGQGQGQGRGHVHPSLAKRTDGPDRAAAIRPAISVEAAQQDGAVQIRVSDNGPGVPAEVRPRIFEALFTTKAKGTGLGLALSKRIVEAHGGTIVLEAPQRGASFLVTIPDAPAAQQEAAK